MNTKSEDVVKNVESTSNEQRQTVKPIVISRRRLLKAGAAGIPVVLTMAGVAPGIEGINAASAASGMNYDGLGTVNRIKDTVTPENGLIWSDEDGFVLNSHSGGYYTKENGLKSDTGNYSASVTNADPGFVFVNSDSSQSDSKAVSNITLNLSLNEGNISGNPRLHKLGNYYISKDDVSLATLATSQLSGTAGEYTLTDITLDSSQAPVFDLDNWDKATDKNSIVWYCLTQGNAATNSTIKSVTIRVASLSISDGSNTYVYSPTDGIDFTFNNIAVQLPTKLN